MPSCIPVVIILLCFTGFSQIIDIRRDTDNLKSEFIFKNDNIIPYKNYSTDDSTFFIADTLNDTIPEDSLQNGALVRRSAVRFYTAGFGPANLQNVESEGLAYNFFGGYMWEPADYAMIRASGDITTDFSNSLLLSASLGANLYPLIKDISPFIGGEMGFGYSRGGGDNTVGLSFGGFLGAQFFRTSDTQLIFELKLYILLNETGEGAFPLSYLARIGLLF
ncbi:MAG TPA: hypothetical protein VKY57_00275 [Chitinispirillaceae bacterium]|nr:hypothetical protein [Chitinispirillaceae bacterium]